MNKPWMCPRCRAWNGPSISQCTCKPIKREYCGECFGDSYAVLYLSDPSMDDLEELAENYHKNFEHRNKGWK